MELFIDIMQILAVLLVGMAIGFFAAKKYMENHIKKNPPINEQMIRAMMTQMGRTPSQKQVNQMMKAMTKHL